MPISVGPKELVQVPDVPEALDGVLCVEPNTFIYLAYWNEADQGVSVSGFTTTGHTWSHVGKVAAGWFARFVAQEPMNLYALMGDGAETALMVYAETRKTVLIRLADVEEIRGLMVAQMNKAAREGSLVPIAPNSVN